MKRTKDDMIIHVDGKSIKARFKLAGIREVIVSLDR